MNPCFYESVQILHDWIVPSEDHTISHLGGSGMVGKPINQPYVPY